MSGATAHRAVNEKRPLLHDGCALLLLRLGQLLDAQQPTQSCELQPQRAKKLASHVENDGAGQLQQSMRAGGHGIAGGNVLGQPVTTRVLSCMQETEQLPAGSVSRCGEVETVRRERHVPHAEVQTQPRQHLG